MMPKLQMSTLGPYSLRVTTSGAIQYGVPTMVVRFALVSEICAQKPKSAETNNQLHLQGHLEKMGRTKLDITIHAEQDVVGLDVAMNDPVPVKML